VADQPRDQSRTGCGATLAWFLTVGLIRAIGRELGWSDRAQLIAVVVALVLVLIVMAARQQPDR
jgi:predicted MFS family arabinose efflux permease